MGTFCALLADQTIVSMIKQVVRLVACQTGCLFGSMSDRLFVW